MYFEKPLWQLERWSNCSEVVGLAPGVNPMISSYNARAVKTYTASSRLFIGVVLKQEIFSFTL
jgi:hypothetical protein